MKLTSVCLVFDICWSGDRQSKAREFNSTVQNVDDKLCPK